jgi:hypothetical protein
MAGNFQSTNIIALFAIGPLVVAEISADRLGGAASSIVSWLDMRLLFPSLLLLCAVGAVAQQAQTKPASPSHRVKHQQPDSNQAKAGNVAPSPDTGNGQVVIFVEQKSSEQNDERAKQSGYWDKVISPEVLPIWIASLLAIIGTVVAVCTLKAIEREAREIQEVAKAATRNADALMLGDRAWVLIRKTLTQDDIQDPYLPTLEQMALDERLPHCIFYLKNYGKTPAKIIAWRYELQIGENARRLPDTSIFEMKGLHIFTPDMIPQSESIAQQAQFKALSGVEVFDDVAQGKKFLWLCGFVRYVDTFERGPKSEHETRFCYLWETRLTSPEPAWIRAGLREYTDAT